MAIPIHVATGTVLAIWPENPAGTAPQGLQASCRVLAPIYNPRGYVKHWPATVLDTPSGPGADPRVTVAYDDGHGVGHYFRIHRGNVYQVDLTVIR